jgi:hypothetical protein
LIRPNPRMMVAVIAPVAPCRRAPCGSARH